MNEHEYLISVIVPVYNAKDYLDKCIQSVLSQSFEDYELILVDDGSTDGSREICDMYAQNDERIITIHKKNGGVSEARECGIKHSKANYVAFIDADDYISEDYLKVLYQDIEKYHADIACCDCVEIVDGVQTNRFRNVLNNRLIEDKAEYIQDYVEKKEFYGYVVWAKLIRKDLLIGQSFKKIPYGEDTVYIFNLFARAKITTLNVYKGYFYIRNKESATIKGAKGVLIPLNHIYIGEALVQLSSLCSKDIQETAANLYAAKIYSALSVIIKNDERKSYDENHHFICQHINAVLKLKGICGKLRLMLQFYKTFPQIYWVVVHSILQKKLKCNKE